MHSINHQTLAEHSEILLKSKKTLKGVSKVVIKPQMKHNDYVDVMETNVALKPRCKYQKGQPSYLHIQTSTIALTLV